MNQATCKGERRGGVRGREGETLLKELQKCTPVFLLCREEKLLSLIPRTRRDGEEAPPNRLAF